MIPVNLKLSNFTSYGENPPELDFTKFHMAAISGANGAGKSSLLDAITWCLWGSSRAGDSADSLIKLGQEQMQVEFSFELDNHLYTVKRKRSKKSGGHTALEFWSNSHNLTEGTIKATQEKIINTLHLSFETFTNSSFLRQGHADEFTTKGPTDRKRILADILGLDHYDKLEEKAKEKIKESQTKLTLLEYQLLEIETELSQKEERTKLLSQAEEESQLAEKQLTEIEKLIKEADLECKALEAKVQLLEERKTHIENIKKEVVDLRLHIELKQKAQEEYQLLLSKKEDIVKNYAKLQKLLEDKKVLEIKRTELIKVKDELVQIQKTVNELEERRNRKIALIEIDLKKYQTENEKINLQIEQLKNKKDLCPTCGQPIGLEKNREIIESNLKEIKKNDLQINELNEQLKKVKGFDLKEKKEAEQKELIVKKIEEETEIYFELNQNIKELEKFDQLNIKLQQAETAIKTHLEAVADLQKLVEAKEKQIKISEEDIKILTAYQEKLKEKRRELQARESTKQELAKKALEKRSEVGEAKVLVSRSEQLEKMFNKGKEEKKKLTKEKEIYEELSLAFGKKGIQAMIIEQAIPEIEDETNRLLDKLTESRMKVSLQTQKEIKTKVQTSEGKIYAVVETLDIIISDEMGQRPYELYSGGETFRVNFAIRLAISKLLTHRAGAKLQFLVIDEGFGTQDAPGRARLVEVIDSIKNDFEKIIIITHLEELKEEFPVRIEVSKTVLGSTLEIVGV